MPGQPETFILLSLPCQNTMLSIAAPLARLEQLLDSVPPLLRALSEKEFSERPAPGKWSKKEIMGHLLDSAANNHHRLVRGQFEHLPVIAYNQDLWNRHNYYHLVDGKQVIQFWETYNRQLAALMKNMPPQLLDRKVQTGEHKNKNIMTLQFVFEDYVAHMQHHLRQVVQYEMQPKSPKP